MLVNIQGQNNFSESIKKVIRENDKETLSKLIDRLDVNLNEVKDHDNNTLLHLSVKLKRDEIIKFFIDHDCDVNARNKEGTTPLLDAVKINYHPAIKTLLKAKANITLFDNDGMNVLKFILINNKGSRLELVVLFANHLKKSKLDVKELALLMQEAKWPIQYAIYIKNSKLIKLMLEADCDVNSCDKETDSYTALLRVTMYNDIEMIKILLQHGADTDKVIKQRISPFSCALKNPKVFETFLDHRDALLERFNCDGKMESFEIFSYALYEVIELLFLKYKINLTTKDSRGNTFLHCVVLNRRQGIVDLLSKTNFDVNIRNNHGYTLLHAVIGYNYPSCVEMLIDKGADVNAQNNNGDTPLMVAINRFPEEKALDLLIKNGAVLNEEMQNRILTMEKNIKDSIIELVLKRMAILNLQGNEISERNLSLINSSTYLSELWYNFFEEIDLMKFNIITVDSNVSVFDLLSASENKLLNYTRNEKIVGQFAKIDFQFLYPFFGRETKQRFEFAIVKENLIQDAIDILSKNIEQLKCNSQVIENIVKYLSTNDLKRLPISSPPV